MDVQAPDLEISQSQVHPEDHKRVSKPGVDFGRSITPRGTPLGIMLVSEAFEDHTESSLSWSLMCPWPRAHGCARAQLMMTPRRLLACMFLRKLAVCSGCKCSNLQGHDPVTLRQSSDSAQISEQYCRKLWHALLARLRGVSLHVDSTIVP